MYYTGVEVRLFPSRSSSFLYGGKALLVGKLMGMNYIF
jgi:hypothetical protein